MEIETGYRPKYEIKMTRPGREIIGTYSDTILVMKLPTSLVLRILSRSLFLATVLLALPSIRLLLRGSSSPLCDLETIVSSSIDIDLVPLLFRDLKEEGLVSRSDNALILSSDFEKFNYDLALYEVNKIHLVLESDLGGKSPDDTFDLVFALGSRDSEFENRVLKIGGLLVVKLSDDSLNAFQILPNYKIVYVRRFNSTIVAMKKTGSFEKLANIEKKVNICVPSKAKKVILKDLEDPYFEPPSSQELATLTDHSKEFKFLTDQLSNLMENYSRRIFITDEIDNDYALQWFYQNYPKKRQHFDLIKTDKITDWIKKNVTEDDFVVVKAEADSVEDMMREKTICLVDELFLECEFERQGFQTESDGKRAYWECLALFGKLRKEGVAVHQWWGY